LARDGRLITTVALALIGLPAAVSAFVDPSAGLLQQSQTPGGGLLALVVALIGLVGQLAIIRLVVGPSISVGEAIRHGADRALAYIGSALIVVLGFVVLAIPFLVILGTLGVPVGRSPEAIPASAWLLVLIFCMIAMYLAVRLMLSSPVASNEALGPLGILRRSWDLTAGHAARLIGFILLFVLGFGITLGALSLAAGSVAGLLFGPVHPFNASALLIGLVSGLSGAVATVFFVVMITHFYLQLTGAEGQASVPSSR
jgi:hypothetical protein